MRLAPVSSLNAAAIYGLLTVTYSFPTSLDLTDNGHGTKSLAFTNLARTLPISLDFKDGDHHPLERRMKKFFGIKSSKSKNQGQGQGHDPSGGLPASTAESSTARRPKSELDRGRERIAALDEALRAERPVNHPFTDLEAKLPGYTVLTPPREQGITEVRYIAKTQAQADDEAAWIGRVDTRNQLKYSMDRESEYREGGLSDYFNHYKPVNERIFPDDIIARTWRQYGQNQPMTSNKVLDIKNERLTNQLDAWAEQTKSQQLRITEADGDAWAFVMGSSAGSPLARALAKHPDIFHNHRPTEVVFSKGSNTMWQAEFTLARGPRPTVEHSLGQSTV